MQNPKNQEQQLIARIRLLGFIKKNTIADLKYVIQKNPEMMTALATLVNCREHKDYQLSLSQISRIAINQHGLENLNAYKMYYPKLKKKGFNIEKLLDMLEIHAPFLLFPLLHETLLELKPKGWNDKSIEKLFCHLHHLEKLDLLKEYFFQFKEWQLSKQQIRYLLDEHTPAQLESLVSSINHLKAHDYTLSTLFKTLNEYGAAHLNALKNFTTTSIANHYTRNEILAITHHPDGCQRLESLQYNYRDLAAMGHTPVKIKSIIQQELHSPDAFIHQNWKELDIYLQEAESERQKWFKQEQYSMFASTEEINERCEMYLEDLLSRKTYHF